MVTDRHALALMHVTKARDIVAEQRDLIAKIKRSTAFGAGRRLLRVFEKVARNF